MNRKQTNRVTMFKTTAGYLNDNNSVWNAMSSFVTSVQQLNDKLSAIDQTAQTQETPTAGAAVDKAAARESLEDVLFLMCEALGLIGMRTSNNDLLTLTALSPASIHRFNDEGLANRAATVLERANGRKTDLAELHVTQENIDELSQALENFTGAKEKPRTVTATRVAETESLESLIRDVNGLLRHEIDRLVNLFLRANSKFVGGYRSARVVVDRPATHAPPKEPATPTTTTES